MATTASRSSSPTWARWRRCVPPSRPSDRRRPAWTWWSTTPGRSTRRAASGRTASRRPSPCSSSVRSRSSRAFDRSCSTRPVRASSRSRAVACTRRASTSTTSSPRAARTMVPRPMLGPSVPRSRSCVSGAGGRGTGRLVRGHASGLGGHARPCRVAARLPSGHASVAPDARRRRRHDRLAGDDGRPSHHDRRPVSRPASTTLRPSPGDAPLALPSVGVSGTRSLHSPQAEGATARLRERPIGLSAVDRPPGP